MKWGMGILVILVLVGGGWWWMARSGKGLLTPVTISFDVEKEIEKKPDKTKSTDEVVKLIKNKISGAKGKYGVFVYRLDSGESYGVNQDEEFPAASMMKVPAMIAAYKMIGQGSLNLTDSYPINAEDIQTGSGPLQFVTPGTTVTLDRILAELGKKSDNTAWVKLNKIVKLTAIRGVMKEMGMNQSSYDDLTTSALDMAIMWKKLEQDNYLNGEQKAMLWEDLQDSIYEDRIPAGVPEDVTVVHKVGTDVDVWGDSGIVYGDKPFILVILDKEVDRDEAAKIVPDIAKLIWENELVRGKNGVPE